MQAARCECGYNFAKGHIDGSLRESYALIHSDDYLRVMKKEHLLTLESRRKRRLKMIAESSEWVGSLMECPECGIFLLVKPQRNGDDGEMILLRRV
jgi:DNA-directed RNA polymerase subunit RPC12/RpoP